MKCKYCKSIIENGSLYCRFCGAQLFAAQKKEMPVPKPRQLSDGRWVGQLMVDGKRHSVYGNTQEEYEINARATKAGLIAMRYERPKLALSSVIDRYISANENVLSPSTLRGYRMIREHRFASYMGKCLTDIDWQVMVSEEAALCSAKTLRNAWGLVSASLTAIGDKTPNVHLPKTAKKELPFLNYLEIQAFLEALHGKPCELAALLALHSLRLSELLALDAEDISNGFIHVNKAVVRDSSGVFVLKKTTKTSSSARDVPIMIARLTELLPESGRLVTGKPSTLLSQVNRICKDACLPLVGFHGLRRSFASLCYHLKWSERSVMAIGGWSNMQTVHAFYIKLSQYDLNEDVKSMQDYYGFTADKP